MGSIECDTRNGLTIQSFREFIGASQVLAAIGLIGRSVVTHYVLQI